MSANPYSESERDCLLAAATEMLKIVRWAAGMETCLLSGVGGKRPCSCSVCKHIYDARRICSRVDEEKARTPKATVKEVEQ